MPRKAKPPSVTVTDPDGSRREVHARPWGDGWRLALGGGTLPAGTRLPASLEYLHLGGGSLPPGTQLPAGLRVLSLGGGTLPHGTAVPEGCDVEGVGPEGIHARPPTDARALLAQPPAPRPAIDLWI